MLHAKYYLKSFILVDKMESVIKWLSTENIALSTLDMSCVWFWQWMNVNPQL